MERISPMPDPTSSLPDLSDADFTEAGRRVLRDAGTLAATNVTGDPEAAARSTALSAATGVPSSVIHLDPDRFENNLKASVTHQLVSGNPTLAAYAGSDPMASIVSNDDWGNLHRLSTGAMRTALALRALNQPETWAGLAQDKSRPLGERIGWAALEEGRRIGLSAVDAFNVFGDIVSGKASMADPATQERVTAAAGWFGQLGAPAAGEGLSSWSRVSREYQAAEATPGQPWTLAQKEPPVGLSTEIDQAKAKVNSSILDMIKEDNKEARTGNNTIGRSPELVHSFMEKQHYGQTAIGVNSDAIRALYLGKAAGPGDGLLGDIPGIQQKFEDAYKSGGDVKIPVADWVSRVDPAVTEQLRPYVRGWPGGITEEEARTPAEPLGPMQASVLSQMRRAMVTEPTPLQAIQARSVGAAESGEPSAFPQLDQLSPEVAGLTKKSLEQVATKIDQRLQKNIEASQRLATREQRRRETSEWRENRTAMLSKVEEDIRQQPAVAADLLIGAGELAGEKIRQRMPLRADDLTTEQKAALPAHYYSKNGIPVDEVARWFHFGSGEEMVNALAAYGATKEGRSPKEMLTHLVDAEADRRMEAQYGNLPQNVLTAAKDQALSENELNLILEEYQSKAMSLGQPNIDKALMQAEARETIGRSIAQDVSSDAYQAEMGKHGREAIRFGAADNWTDALVEMQRHARAMTLAREAMKVETALGKFDKTIASYARQWDPTKASGQKVEANYSIFVRDILNRIGKPNGLSVPGLAKAIQDSKFGDLRGFVTKMEDTYKIAGLELPVPEFLMDQSWRKPFDQLTVDEFRQVSDAVTALDKLGRADQKVIQQGREVDRAEWIAKAVAQLRDKFEPIPSGQKKNLASRAITSAIAASTNNETLMSRFDGRDPHGMFTETFTYPTAEGANYEHRLERDTSAEYRALGEVPNRNKAVAHPFIDPRTNRPKINFTRENLAVVVSNMGNDYNWRVMADGWKVDRAVLWKWVEANTTVEDLERAQAMGKIFDKLKGMSDVRYQNMYGVAPENIVVRPFTMHGKTFEGWYHPIIGDPELSRYVNKMPSTEAETNFWPSTSNAYTKRRTGATQVIDLTYDSIPLRMTQMIHDIALREPVANLARLLKDERLREGIRGYYGKEYLNQMDEWLNRVAGNAGYSSDAMRNAIAVSNFFRQNVVTTQIAFNISTVEKHGLTAWEMSARELGPNLFKTVPSFLHVTGEVAWSSFQRAVMDLFGRGDALGDSLWQFVKRMSEEIQRRERNYVDTMLGQHQQFQGQSNLRNAVSIWGAKLVAFSDMVSAIPLWLAKYREELEANGGNIGSAVQVADASVRRAHGSTAISNLPMIATGNNPVTPWMTSLYGFMGTSMQRRIEIFHDLNDVYKLGMKGEIKEASKLLPGILSSLAVYVLWTGVVEEGVTGQFTEDHRGLGQKALTFLFGTAAQTIIGVRDLVYDIEHGTESTGLLSTPIHDVTSFLRDLGKDHPLARWHIGKLVQDGITTLGDMTGVGPKHIGTAARYGIDAFEGFQKPRGAGDIYRGVISGREERFIRR